MAWYIGMCGVVSPRASCLEDFYAPTPGNLPPVDIVYAPAPLVKRRLGPVVRCAGDEARPPIPAYTRFRSALHDQPLLRWTFRRQKVFSLKARHSGRRRLSLFGLSILRKLSDRNVLVYRSRSIFMVTTDFGYGHGGLSFVSAFSTCQKRHRRCVGIQFVSLSAVSVIHAGCRASIHASSPQRTFGPSRSC